METVDFANRLTYIVILYRKDSNRFSMEGLLFCRPGVMESPNFPGKSPQEKKISLNAPVSLLVA